MVDLVNQYQKLKPEIDQAFQEICSKAQFIKGPAVQSFEQNLASYLNIKHVIGCANGTDALQIALMALGLQSGDEVIVPAFTYVATAEVIGLLNLKPIMVDVNRDTFNVKIEHFENALTPKTKAIVPVHLFGQSVDMAPIVEFARRHNLYIIEDNAQAIGSDYSYPDGRKVKTGTIGHIGCTSFFPSKNLGCYGDGGAIFTNDEELAQKIKMIANHGQSKKYYHDLIGCNSRLDSIQAAILDIKLKHLDQYSLVRQHVAQAYDHAFAKLPNVQIPQCESNSTHVFHQYTLIIKNGLRDQLAKHLADAAIPYGIYYPVPLYKQKAFAKYVNQDFELANTSFLCDSVISLPIHTEMDEKQLNYITETVKSFFV